MQIHFVDLLSFINFLSGEEHESAGLHKGRSGSATYIGVMNSTSINFTFVIGSITVDLYNNSIVHIDNEPYLISFISFVSYIPSYYVVELTKL